MKLLAYEVAGTRGWGVEVDGGVRDLSRRLPDLATVDDVLTQGRLDDVRALATGPADLPLDALAYLPPLAHPQKILCIGLNYHDHRVETKSDPGAFPTIFTRFADSHVGHLRDVARPPESTELDWEGELAVVIGARAFHVPVGSAMDHVAGYSVYNDLSVRDWQLRTSQWIAGKNFFGVGAFGPSLVTADEVLDIEDRVLTTEVDGRVVQEAPIGDLIHTIPQLIAYISTFTPLNPGDVIVSGTPGGVGMAQDPPTYLEPGSEVSVTVTGLGTLRNRIV